MSIEGLIDGRTPARRWSPVSSVRCRMSFWLVAITSRSIGSPMRFATQPAKMSPKLPVGTVKLTGRCGAPSATAAVK